MKQFTQITFNKLIKGLALGLIATTVASIALGCSAPTKEVALDTQVLNPNIQQVQERLTTETRIVALGEASHGASELQTLKADVFKALVENTQNPCRVFAIEGDFGGSAKVNAYIHGADGTAQEAVAQIGFKIYRTQEMVDLVNWMRDYNQGAKPADLLNFLGFDMQRYNHNKQYVLDYLNTVSPTDYQNYQAKFQQLTDEKMYDLPKDVLKTAKADLDALITTLQNTALYPPSPEKDFALACALSMTTNTDLRLNPNSYNDIRDKAMKEKVDWICNNYPGLIFINGHNGHISKVANSGYENMGSLLFTAYREKYLSFGTDLRKCQFNGQSGDGYSIFDIENENPITAQLKTLDQQKWYYLDFSSLEQDSPWKKVLSTPQKMVALNVSFDAWQKMMPSMYTLKINPLENYDGLFLIGETKASTFLE